MDFHQNGGVDIFAQKCTSIGLKVAYYRKIRGYTQAKLAKRAQISTSYLSRIECGNCSRSISLYVLFCIAQALEMDISNLFNDKNL